MSILARSRPYPTTLKDTYTCRRCGIQKVARLKNKPHYCLDCRAYKPKEN